MTVANDADILAAQFAEAAATAAAGVCPLCEEALDPFDQRWADEISQEEARSIAECYGPAAAGLPYHERCLSEDDSP